jgi:hypothetical protein
MDETITRLRKSGAGSFLFTQALVQAAKQHAQYGEEQYPSLKEQVLRKQRQQSCCERERKMTEVTE